MMNTAIVGLGWWGRHIVETLQGKSDKISFSRGVDVDPKAAERFARVHKLTLSDSLADALADDEVQAVILATPHSLHEEQIIAAAGAGKHVFCEKPLALSKASAERSVAACEAAGVVLGLGHERRFEPAMIKIRELVKTGLLGEIMHVESAFSHDKLANMPADNWRISKAESPGAAMTATGIHITDAYANMFGSVDEVFAMTATRNPANANGDVLSFQVRFKSGATGYFSSILETPLYMRFCVYGSKGWIEAKDFHHPSEPGPTYVYISKKEGVVDSGTYEWADTVKMNIEAWATAALGGDPYPFTTEEKIENIAIFEAICQSAETGQPVKLG
ncbi:MAG: Gfo/Idh/MocA family oxidoreductase [Rhodospirillaceae bacterium]|jgi:predicted dehydrogenase